jgi:hypothetical protein
MLIITNTANSWSNSSGFLKPYFDCLFLIEKPAFGEYCLSAVLAGHPSQHLHLKKFKL